MNVNSPDVNAILENENGSCVDVILENESGFYVGVILVNGNDLGIDVNWIGWIPPPLHRFPTLPSLLSKLSQSLL